MKRLLIFIFLFPAIAPAATFAVLYVLTGAGPDSLSGAGFACLIFVVPALAFAGVDGLLTTEPIPAVVGTTLIGYAAAVLCSAMLLHRGFDEATLTFGLVAAIPAAVCSWLSERMSADVSRAA